MKSVSECHGARTGVTPFLALPLALAVFAGACAPAVTTTPTPGSTAPAVGSDHRAPHAPMPDPRVGLRAGLTDAEEAIWNMRLVSQTPPARDFIGVTNSDLAFTGDYAIQGN